MSYSTRAYAFIWQYEPLLSKSTPTEADYRHHKSENESVMLSEDHSAVTWPDLILWSAYICRNP